MGRAEMVDQPIRLAPYDPAWPERFERERVDLERAIGPWLAGGIKHVGSTAVPGLEAKPTIDVMAPVRDLDEARACFEPLAALGYVNAPHRPYFHWFCKPSPARRTHHLTLIEPTHPEWAARLAFRDRLRADPEAAAEYAQLKRRLAARHADAREAYTEAKESFVRRIVREAAR
jgi:GrpB-like predicted nucleotidyltransferase (UPF0157 family)